MEAATQQDLEIIQLMEDLIRIPSTHSRPDEIDSCADFIEQWLTLNTISFQRKTCGTTPSILVLPQADYSPVLLMAHFDVVEAENTALFSPCRQDGRLYGRGAVDDKYAVALSLILFRDHLRRLRQDGLEQGDMAFGLLLTGDEELGGAEGAGYIARSLDTDFVLALDGGNTSHIVTREKGILNLKLTARGRSAHAARPWLGSNAFDLLTRDYLRLQEMFKESSADHWHRTMVLSNCRSGNGSTNMVPDHAEAIIDIRFTESDDPEELISLIKEQVTSEVTVLAREPLFTGGQSTVLDLLVKHSNGATLGFEHGASDARYFSQRGIPGAVWGADGEMSQHTEEEHIVLSSLFSLRDSLEGFLLDLQFSHLRN